MRRLVLVLFLIVLLSGEASAQGSLTIPNTFAGKALGPLGQLDQNWQAIADYVNSREVRLGTLAARPTAGVKGRLYVATDNGGGVLYEDNGTAWTLISGNQNTALVTDFGAKCDGVTDDAATFRTIANTAIASGITKVLIPATTTGCNIGSLVVWPRGVAIEGVGAPAQNSNSGSSFLNHSGLGTYTMFQFDGTGTADPGGGYLMRNLTIRQTAGTGTNTAGVGTGLRVACTSTTTRATWVRLENVNFEEQTNAGFSTTDPWTTTLDIDGSGCNGLGVTGTIRDIWISNSRIHNNATAGTPNAIKLTFAVNVFLMNLELTGSGGNLTMTGSPGNLTSSVNCTFIQATTMALDYAQNVMEYGGQYVNLTNTVNTAGANILMPLTVTNGFVNNAPTTTLVARFNTAQGFWQLSNGVLLPNAQSILGTQSGGSVNSLIQLGAANKVNIDASGLGVAFGGGIQTQTNGVQSGSPTGADKGTGTFNAAAAPGYYQNGTAISTVTLKTGSGAGDYTTVSASYADVDATNLALTVTIPTGFKLLVEVTCAVKHSALAAVVTIGILDTSIVAEEAIDAAVAGDREHMGLVHAITGDGASHTVKLQWKTSAATASMINGTATLNPRMTFLMVPSS